MIRKGIEAFKCKFEPFETDSKYSKVVRSILIQILTIRQGFEAFKCKFEPFDRDSKYSNANSNHSKGIRNIQMQIRLNRSTRATQPVSQGRLTWPPKLIRVVRLTWLTEQTTLELTQSSEWGSLERSNQGQGQGQGWKFI